ncbi:MAG: efflux RND transporter periplasmic adaptor subunit, partial [Leptospira sp.]|nr:efflux RND transporter periplasmic adaptor subunit [Leptospira sp.]
DFEIVNLGMRDEDISRAGYKIPKKKEEKEKVLREINTKIEKAEMEVAEGTVKSHESQMEATRILLKECTLYSPMDGVVARKYKSRGEMINGGAGQSSQAILTLVYMDEVYGVFNIPEQDSPVIKNRMKVNFTADIFPEKVFSGSIVQVSPLIDPKTHTVEVKAVIPNNKKKLKPGMFIRANIVTGEPENMILLQNTALLPKEGDSAFVFVIRENQVFKAEVKTGKKYGEKLEIKEGLREGDVVVLEKISQLREGIKALPLF